MFPQERERYELEILSKQAGLPNLKALPYTASIDRTLLKSLFFMGKFDNIAKGVVSASSLTDEHMKTYVQSLVSRTDKTIDHVAIEKVLADLAMPMEIADAGARSIRLYPPRSLSPQSYKSRSWNKPINR